jgi:hypothetical protein
MEQAVRLEVKAASPCMCQCTCGGRWRAGGGVREGGGGAALGQVQGKWRGSRVRAGARNPLLQGCREACSCIARGAGGAPAARAPTFLWPLPARHPPRSAPGGRPDPSSRPRHPASPGGRAAPSAASAPAHARQTWCQRSWGRHAARRSCRGARARGGGGGNRRQHPGDRAAAAGWDRAHWDRQAEVGCPWQGGAARGSDRGRPMPCLLQMQPLEVGLGVSGAHLLSTATSARISTVMPLGPATTTPRWVYTSGAARPSVVRLVPAL